MSIDFLTSNNIEAYTSCRPDWMDVLSTYLLSKSF